ncbi:hypothetical protein L596_012648 [Steinernema carpocapsae]|uniref:Serpentine receptor class gamma n=1 Tax=Steinernema carpocapsae TaxID=34508 RepID=A0A4V6A4V0_STECR|nr:hypothetical protein L596_012648 [Steinernema carpocapsae]
MSSAAVYYFHLKFNIYLTIVTGLSSLLIYAVIIGSLIFNRKKRKSKIREFREKMSNLVTDTNVLHETLNKVELKLTIVVLFHTLLLATDAGTAIIMFVVKEHKKELSYVNFFVQDLLCGSNPYLLLAFSSQLRKRISPIVKQLSVTVRENT